MVAEALNVTERQPWPDLADSAGPKDDRGDLVAIYASAGDVRAPDWRVMLYDARDWIDLLGSTLADIITTPGVIDILTTKADAGCQINILIAHPKSIWVTTLAQQLGQDQPDDHGNTPLDHELNRPTACWPSSPTTPGSTFGPTGPNTPTRSCASTTKCSSPCTSTSTPPATRHCCPSNVTPTPACSTSSPPTSTRSPNTPATQSTPTPTSDLEQAGEPPAASESTRGEAADGSAPTPS
jgi:hypothetical protein